MTRPITLVRLVITLAVPIVASKEFKPLFQVVERAVDQGSN
jgi:hypothetical protein